MNVRVIMLLLLTACFGALTAIALWDVGYWGIVEPHFKSWGAAQVFFDLVILALMACVWMVHDGKKCGLNPWPFVGITLFLGSFGPLSYLIVRAWGSGKREVAG